MTQLDVALWLGMLCISLAMTSFAWGRFRGFSALALCTLLAPLALVSSGNLMPEFGLVGCQLLAAVVPAPKQLGLEPREAPQASREEEPVLR